MSVGSSMKPLLVARGVSKRFGAVEALVDVDFDVDAGEVVALVGDNGAGKSTLIKAIAGVQPADAGEYWIDGRKVASAPRRTPRGPASRPSTRTSRCATTSTSSPTSISAPSSSSPAWVSVRRSLDETAMERRTRELLASLSVTTLDSPRAQVGSLSGGQRQAVAIARSLVDAVRAS